MDCRTIRTLAAGKRLEELPADVRAHLDVCEACYDELEDLPSILITPAFAIPPPDLTQRILTCLPDVPPAVAARQEWRQKRRRRVAAGLLIALVVIILQIGILGVFVDSEIPARMVGGVESSAGRLILALTIAIKPIASALTLISVPLFLVASIAVIVAAWLWLRLMAPPAPLLVEVRP